MRCFNLTEIIINQKKTNDKHTENGILSYRVCNNCRGDGPGDNKGREEERFTGD